MVDDRRLFWASVFFVLGFASVFSILGVLLQTVLSGVSYEVQLWLSRVGGVFVVLFGVYLLDVIKIPFLMQEHKFHLKRKFTNMYLGSFLFGAVFAAGWTPCIGPVLGAILTLAAAHPSTSLMLLFSYSLGIGIPFLLVGAFSSKAQDWITRSMKRLVYLRYVFGVILIILGVMVFTSTLGVISRLGALFSLPFVEVGLIGSNVFFNVLVSFLAGIVSFLSPCVLPLVPVFLTYLASIGIEEVARKGSHKK